MLGTEHGCDRKGFQCWKFSQPMLKKKTKKKRQLALQQSASENKLNTLIPETNPNMCVLDVWKQR